MYIHIKYWKKKGNAFGSVENECNNIFQGSRYITQFKLITFIRSYCDPYLGKDRNMTLYNKNN